MMKSCLVRHPKEGLKYIVDINLDIFCIKCDRLLRQEKAICQKPTFFHKVSFH